MILLSSCESQRGEMKQILKRLFGSKSNVRVREYDTTSCNGHDQLMRYLEGKEGCDEFAYGVLSEPKPADKQNLSELESKLSEISTSSVEIRTYRTDLLLGGTTGVAVTEYPLVTGTDQIKKCIIGTFRQNQAFPSVEVPSDFNKLWTCIGYREKDNNKLIRLDTARQGDIKAMTVSYEVYIRSQLSQEIIRQAEAEKVRREKDRKRKDLVLHGRAGGAIEVGLNPQISEKELAHLLFWSAIHSQFQYDEGKTETRDLFYQKDVLAISDGDYLVARAEINKERVCPDPWAYLATDAPCCAYSLQERERVKWVSSSYESLAKIEDSRLRRFLGRFYDELKRAKEGARRE